MFTINGKTITLTRGDTFVAQISLTDSEGHAYTLAEGDVIRFAAKRAYHSTAVLITKAIPHETMLLTLNPQDTKNLPFGEYVYDIQLTYANGDVDTVIDKGALVLTEEVD